MKALLWRNEKIKFSMKYHCWISFFSIFSLLKIWPGNIFFYLFIFSFVLRASKCVRSIKQHAHNQSLSIQGGRCFFALINWVGGAHKRLFGSKSWPSAVRSMLYDRAPNDFLPCSPGSVNKYLIIWPLIPNKIKNMSEHRYIHKKGAHWTTTVRFSFSFIIFKLEQEPPLRVGRDFYIFDVTNSS